MRIRYLCQVGSLLLLVLSLCSRTLSGDVILNCDEFEQHLYMDANDAFCTVTGFIVTHSQNVVVKNFLSGNMVKFMKFYDSTLLYVPFHLFETFTHLKTLDISYTSILDLPRNTFSAASNLTYLNLSYNNLSSVQTSVFIGASALTRLDLSFNKIATLSENAFCGLHSLNKVHLTGNRLSELHKDIFKDNEYLESVFLEHNELVYVQPEVFNRMRRIKELHLSSNQLKSIHADTFAEATNLESLSLAYNNLHVFQLKNKSISQQLQLDYNHLTNLTVNGTRFVHASYNNISEIFFYQTLYLETLELRGNRLASIANITSMTSLIQLDVSHNPIGPLSVSTFDQLKRLRMLQLRSTGIRELEFGMFSKQKYLELLDLSFNNLTSLNLDIFVPYLTNIKQFLVDGNEISEVLGNRSFTKAFPLLQKLGISRNRFNCSYLHHLLIPPFLLDTVLLNIEPDDSVEETPHIRDVSCISLNSAPAAATAKDKQEAAIALEEPALQKQLELLQLHLFYMKFFFYAVGGFILLAVIALFSLRFIKLRRSGRYNRSSIVFRSNATMDANLQL